MKVVVLLGQKMCSFIIIVLFYKLRLNLVCLDS